MEIPELTWDSVVLDDPDGGKIILWPHLPCIRMPNSLRTHDTWDGLALLASTNDLASWRKEEADERESPGIHRDSALSSGTSLGRLMSDLVQLEIDGPTIPDPEQIRLLRHAEKARGGLPIFAIEPELDDEEWANHLAKSADEQVRLANLLATLRTGKRWKKIRAAAVEKVSLTKGINADLGAAAASCATWFIEDNRWNSIELLEQRDSRFAARLRGALATLRDSRVDDGKATEPTLLVPIHQAWLPSLVKALKAWPEAESVAKEET